MILAVMMKEKYMDKPQTFEQSWESFRLANDISQEEFVASGYGFVEKLDQFVEIQRCDRIIKLEKKLAEAESDLKGYHMALMDQTEKLKVACEALQELDKLKRCALCDRVEIAREALSKIKSEGL